MEMQQMIERLLAGQEEIKTKADAVREERKADREQMDAKLKDLKEDIKSSQAEMRYIVDTWITDIKDARKKTTACQKVTGVNSEKMEPNPEEKEAIVEWQEILRRHAEEGRWLAKKRQRHVLNARSQSQRT
jgi:hypothetical protein